MKLIYTLLAIIACSFLEAGVVQSSSAYLTSNLTNATGNGPIVAVPFDAVTFDSGSCFNLSNGEYTAPGNGTLIITGICEISNLSSNHNTWGVYILNVTQSEQRYVFAINPYPIQDTVPPSGYSQLPFSETMRCSQGDVFVLKCFVQGGTQTVTINGGNRETRLSMNFFPD